MAEVRKLVDTSRVTVGFFHCPPGDVAWRLFFNALEQGAARRQAQVEGEPALAEPLFRVRSVMV